jgi:hypothetical protein
MLYHMVWAGLKADLLAKVRPLRKAIGKFNSVDKLLDRVADVESKLHTYDKQQQKPAGESSRPGGKKRNFRPSISATEDIPNYPSKLDESNSSSGGRKHLPQSR